MTAGEEVRRRQSVSQAFACVILCHSHIDTVGGTRTFVEGLAFFDRLH